MGSSLGGQRHLNFRARAVAYVVLLLTLIGFAPRLTLPQTTPCTLVESEIVNRIVQGIEGTQLDVGELADLLDQAENCVLARELSSYQRFSLVYALAYGRYYLGIAEQDMGQLSQAQQAFARSVDLYNPNFDMPDKYEFSLLMPAWISLRRFQITGDVNHLRNALGYLNGCAQFGECSNDAVYLRALIRAYLAHDALARGRYSEARVLFGDATHDMESLPPSDNRQYLSSLTKLLWARAGLLERTTGGNEGPSDDEIVQLIGAATVGRDACESTLRCIACVARQGSALRRRLQTALMDGTTVQPVPSCLGDIGDRDCAGMGVLRAISVFLANDVPALGAAATDEAAMWRDWGRFLRYYRSRVPNLGDGGGVLAGLFGLEVTGNNWRERTLDKLRTYGALLSRLLACDGAALGVNAGDLPDDRRLHVNELLELANGVRSESAGLMALTLGNASNDGCLYQRAENIFANLPAGDSNDNVERLVRLACAHAKGRAFGPVPGLDVIENQLVGIQDNELDQAHRIEKYYTLGTIHQFSHGWDGTARNYFGAVDELDPRSAYMLHAVAHPPAANDLPVLQRALWQVRHLIQNGLSMKWLEERLVQHLQGLPPVAGPVGDLLPDSSYARWDILDPLLSEANLARKFYINLYEALSEYAYSLSPIPSVPLPWRRSRPQRALRGPREFNLESEILVSVSVQGGSDEDIHLWVLDGRAISYEDSSYGGGEFPVTAGSRCRIIVWCPGFWPREIDTVFVAPHQTVELNLQPVLTVGGRERVPFERKEYVVWIENDESLLYDPTAHAYLFKAKNAREVSVLQQEKGEVYSGIAKFCRLRDGRYVFLDVGRNSIYVSRLEDMQRGELTEIRDLRSLCGVEHAIDMAVLEDKLYFLDGGRRKVVRCSLDDEELVEVALDSTISFATAIFVDTGSGQLWVTDAVRGVIALHTSEREEWVRLPGLWAATSDGLRMPWRMFRIEKWGFIAVEDLATSQIYLFLPVGEYVGYLPLSDVDRALVSIAQNGERTLMVSTGLDLWRIHLEESSGPYAFRLLGEYRHSEMTRRLWGGWLVCP